MDAEEIAIAIRDNDLPSLRKFCEYSGSNSKAFELEPWKLWKEAIERYGNNREANA